jgi:uncharacterized protein (DUF4415 family)
MMISFTRSDEGEANARLVAEAPAMLEALRYAADVAGEMLALGETWQERARAILRRIDG